MSSHKYVGEGTVVVSSEEAGTATSEDLSTSLAVFD